MFIYRSKPCAEQRSNQVLDKVHAQRCFIPQPASGSAGHSPSQGTQPDEYNPVIVEPQNLHHLKSGCFVAPEVNRVPKELISGDGSQKKMFVFQNTIPKRYSNLQEVKDEGFPSKEEFIHCKDGEVIYSNKVGYTI